MKISKEYRWEMGHRLPNHKGPCRNIHGHSYRMIVELEGDVMKNGMVIDFYELSEIVKPLLGKFDHSFLVYSQDKELLKFLSAHKMKKNVVNYLSTVENISEDFLKRIISGLKKKKIKNLTEVTVKIFETPNSFAECSCKY